MGPISATLIALGLIIALFAVAFWVERRPRTFRQVRVRHLAYTLSLAVYCTSWTFYGAVGSAARDGWSYLPIYAAPILVLLLAPTLLRKMARAVREERSTTISDFIAARFGHDAVIARLVTLTAMLGSVPYIALQLRSIGTAVSTLSGGDALVPAMLAAAPFLALFAILFGARRYEIAGRSEGLLFSIALESLIKLVALVTVGAFAIYLLLTMAPAHRAIGAETLAANFAPSRLSVEIFVVALLAACAIIALPRQFYMGLVEAQSTDDLPRARFGFSAYLAVMTLVVLPIAMAGLALKPEGAAADLYVLALPLSQGFTSIAMIAFVGGISAATAMVIVESTALATMVSNDLVAPTLIRRQVARPDVDLGRRLMNVRRGAIVAIIAGALLWALGVSPRQPLASIGLIAFAAMAQFTPHLVLASLGRDRNAAAGRASLAVGLGMWVYTLALPPILPAAFLDLLVGSLIDPTRLLGVGHASSLVHGTMWSLGANLLTYATIAAAGGAKPAIPRMFRNPRKVADLAELAAFTRRFVGEDPVRAAFGNPKSGTPIDRKSARRAEELVARVVGGSSARALIASAMAGERLSHDDVARLLDEGGQSLRFSRRLLAATLENIESGISVVDSDLNLIAWNSRYLELFDYPDNMVEVGRPVADLIRHNARNGEFGSGNVEESVERRLGHLRRGLDHSFERRRANGQVIKTVGGPMPGGGYIMSFTDITAEAQVRDELEQTLNELEQRVADRTRELSKANSQLSEATAEKTRFLAAASHDLLQPLHAARLFATALDRDVDDSNRPLVDRIGKSISAAEELLRALLDISKLDAGGVEPKIEPVALHPLLRDIVEGMRPLAEERGLLLRLGPVHGTAMIDAAMLRSVIQNLLSNALRYTQHGGVLVGMRKASDGLRIDVVDTGTGIPPDQLQSIFREFTRLGNGDAEGIGLGLAIVERVARLLDAKVSVASTVGKGSRFSILVPEATGGRPQARATSHVAAPTGKALTLLVLDNDSDILDAMSILLRRQGHAVIAARSAGEALAAPPVDAVIADYHLGEELTGLDVIDQLRLRRVDLPVIIISADTGANLRIGARDRGIELQSKPVSARALDAFLGAVSMPKIEA